MPNVNEYMLKQADAETIYQKKLNAGTGINIDPLTDTISATGSGGSTVTYTPNVTAGMILGVLGINGTSNPIKSPSLIAGQNVSITQDQTTGALTFSSVNTTYNDMVGADGTNAGTHGLAPAPAATDNTKFLKGDGSWGDPVTANPVAAATATLTKLSINNTVYDLAGGTATYLGTTDPSNSLGNNGDLYFKYVSVPAVIEDEVTLPTFVDDQSTHVTVSHFEDYTDVSFGYIDANRNPGTKDFTIEDLPQNNNPQWSQGGDIYIMNGYYYAVASRDSTGFWIKECGGPLQSIIVSYSGYSYNIISTYVKIEGRWIAFSTGGGGAVNDVEVDGVSVVTNGVAEIDLTGKQNALTAGTNINIDTTTNTISATDTTYSDFAGSTHGLVPAVQTQSGKYLKDDGTWGTPSGGGSEVIANPSGTATNVLNKIEIDNIIYSLASGGGGGGSLVTLYEATNETAPNTITLEDDLFNYDYIIIQVRPPASSLSTLATVGFAYIPSALQTNAVIGGFAGSNNAWYYLTSGTSLTKYIIAGGYFISKIIGITGGGGGGTGTGSFVGLTKSQYDALPTADKEDTSKLYLVQEGGGETDVPIDMSGGTVNQESNMSITPSQDKVTSEWNGGMSIGGQYFTTPIDLTDITKLKWTVKTTTCYGHNNSNVEEQTNANWQLIVGIVQSIPSGWITPSNYVTSKIFKYTNTTYSASECELDVSNYTGTYYVVIILHGWNAVVSDLKGTTIVENVTRHTYWNNAKWAQWNQVKELTQAEYNALLTTEKQNGNLYLTHDGGYDFISYDDGKIIVRVNNSTGQTLWFFNGFYKESTDLDIPSVLLPYVPTQTSTINVMMAKSWTDDTSTTTNGWVGFVYPGTSNVKIRTWNASGSQLRAGESWAVLDIDGSTAEFGQTANYSSPTEGLSLLPNRIYYNGKLYADVGDGSGVQNETIYIFKDGSWIPQNYISLATYNTQISGGKLVCSGVHAGVVVKSVAGLSNINSFKYALVITVDSSGFNFQTGRCNPTDDLDAVIRSGTNKITYTNDSMPAGEHEIRIETADNTQGVFLGGYYLDTTTQYDIVEIKLEPINQKAYG